MKRKTTITLTIAGLLGLAGVLYAANHTYLSSVHDSQGAGPVGVVASPTDLLVTDYCTNGAGLANIQTIDCQGGFSVFTPMPAPNLCYERYLAMAPRVSANAGFTPRDLFITQGNLIYQFRPPDPPTLFTTIPDEGCSGDHAGITFDHEGLFENKMIVTCANGGVWKIDGAGTVTNLTYVTFNGEGRELEGPAVVPRNFGGPFAGMLWAADESFPGGNPPGAVHAIDPNGNFFLNIVSWDSVESVNVIPQNPEQCTFCSGGVFFQAIQINFGAGVGIYEYFPMDFAGLGGKVLITSETFHGDPTSGGAAIVSFDGTNYVRTFFDAIPGLNEGSAFADCDIPTPTPTATATATSTPTPRPTPTPTSTPACLNYCKYAVFGLNSVDLGNLAGGGSLTKPGIIGDVAIGGGTGTLEKSTVFGKVFVDSSAHPNIHPDFHATGGIFFNQNLSQDKADALALSAQLAALPCTQTFGKITSNTTITSTGPLNVICVNSVNLTQANITLVGSSCDVFVINVTSPTADFILNGGQIVLSGGLTSDHVIFNFPGTGGMLKIYKPNGVVNGTLLAPQRDILIDKAAIYGSVIGSTIYMHSGAFVQGCQCPSPCP